MTTNTAILFATASLLLLVQEGRADGGVKVDEAMVVVERVLIAQGFKAQGYAATEPPLVQMVERLPSGAWGHYYPGLIELSARQPDGCIPGTLYHELGHDAARKFLLIDEPKLSARAIRKQFEALAELVESAAVTDYTPNCTSPKGH